jgi:hypothetical protein
MSDSKAVYPPGMLISVTNNTTAWTLDAKSIRVKDAFRCVPLYMRSATSAEQSSINAMIDVYNRRWAWPTHAPRLVESVVVLVGETLYVVRKGDTSPRGLPHDTWHRLTDVGKATWLEEYTST